MFKRHTIALFALMGIVISTFAMMNDGEMVSHDNPTGSKLEDNEEYQRLMAENDTLVIMCDSINTLLKEIKEERRLYLDTLTTEPSPEVMHKYSQRIINLEDEIFEISQKQGLIASRINDIEMEIIEAGFVDVFGNNKRENNTSEVVESEDSNTSTEATTEESESTDENITKESTEVVETPVNEQEELATSETETGEESAQTTDIDIETIIDGEEQQEEIEQAEIEVVEPTPQRNMIDNELFTTSLDGKDLEDLRSAQANEIEVEQIINEYINQYDVLRSTSKLYDEATNQHSADSLYTEFAAQIERLEMLNVEISQKWNFVVDTKYYAYGYVIEKERNKELLRRFDDKFNTALQQCANNDGLYTSNGITRYAISRPVITDLEIEISEALGITDALDSLNMVRNTYAAPTYQLAPIELPERRLFIDYEDIVFGRTNYYNSDNPVPDVKVYERGTIYRILLGVFKSRQPITLFKGVRPLYIEKDSNGLHFYYTGGFETYDKAKEAQQLLYDKGFKAPEICCWMDGIMTNLSAGGSIANDDDAENTTSKRYMLRIVEQDMTDDIKQRINELYPTKLISLTKDGYVVGSFDGHDEVTRLFITISDEFGIDLEILEVEIK